VVLVHQVRVRFLAPQLGSVRRVSEHVFVPRPIPFSEADARAAIAQANCWSDALRCLGYEPKGSNFQTLQRWAKEWGIPSDHFDANSVRRRASARRAFPLEEVLVENSTYPRGKLKARLLGLGLKQPRCEMCGQGNMWGGRPISLILDHINGVSNDNRLENLRIVCPNCNATLDTHCGRNLPRQRTCPGCNQLFVPHTMQHRYCSQRCWGAVAANLYRGSVHPATRKVERPSYEQLLTDVQSMSFLAIGRKYGVSDNAVRKWIRSYEYQAERKRSPEESGGEERAA
jgi:HNH endonuclease